MLAMNLKQVLRNKVDVKSGDITYGSYIAVRRLLAEAKEYDLEFMVSVIKAIHSDYKYAVGDIVSIKALVSYFNSIVEGAIHWAEQEKELLAYEPSEEEIRAGVKEYSQKVGEFATVKALAKNYGKDPDEVLEWKYSKVFGILYTDLEEYYYNQRYSKVLERKYK